MKSLGKKGDAGDNPLWENIFYLILLLLFFGTMAGFAAQQRDGAGFWEDFYAKQIALVINSAKPGTEVALNVSKAARIAEERGKSLDEVFYFDNVDNFVRVSLRSNGASSFSYFNDVDVVSWDLKTVSGGIDSDQLVFIVMGNKK